MYTSVNSVSYGIESATAQEIIVVISEYLAFRKKYNITYFDCNKANVDGASADVIKLGEGFNSLGRTKVYK